MGIICVHRLYELCSTCVQKHIQVFTYSVHYSCPTLIKTKISWYASIKLNKNRFSSFWTVVYRKTGRWHGEDNSCVFETFHCSAENMVHVHVIFSSLFIKTMPVFLSYTLIRSTYILKGHICTRKHKPAYSCRAMQQHRLEDSTSVTSLHQGFVSHHWLWLLHAPMQPAPPWLLLGHGGTLHATLLGWNVTTGMISWLNW